MMEIGSIKRLAAFAVLLVFALVFFSACGDDEQLNNEERKAKVMSMYEGYKKDFPEVPDISPEKAIELWKHGQALFVDIREPREQAVSMLPGALTQQQFEQNPGILGDKTLIAYCTISYRSGVFLEKLKDKNLKAFNLQGGILGWVHAGGPVYRGDVLVDKLHVYGKEWDLAPERFHTTY